MDSLRSTGSSHQRTFVVEVMGRHCGYLALMASIATAANWVMIPEQPPPDDWAQQMCRDIEAGRAIGRRQSVVIVAEGAHDRAGNPITAQAIRTLLETELGEDTRIAILGHVQRGGAPAPFDRYRKHQYRMLVCVVPVPEWAARAPTNAGLVLSPTPKRHTASCAIHGGRTPDRCMSTRWTPPSSCRWKTKRSN